MKRHLPTQGFSYSQLLHCSQSDQFIGCVPKLHGIEAALTQHPGVKGVLVVGQTRFCPGGYHQVHFLETWLWPYAVEVNERAPSYGKGILQKGAALKLYASDIDALYQTLPEERRRPDSGPESP
ncbi:uncharacterized protein L3040_007773 [Drepanopeziza brunnea f. sp. 'multigermtubi']|uniref:uncharacterized protein n=1 Tax=Drepanopeziza brunnea f. sp. 'multigermtubi' TaxID=698441 RepID=UPI00239F926A|nr:hypothetical protein L3040_007773 [Drepanopeziza brunnea f. sp. 'multigermtubi']